MDDVLRLQSEFASITSLKIENQALADAFIISNFEYLFSIIGIEINDAQRHDLLDEVGQVGWLTMPDIKLFLDEMKRHKFYRKDYQELIVEFWKYADRRLDRAFEINLSKHEAIKNDLSYMGRVAEEDFERQRQVKINMMRIEAQRHYQEDEE